MNINQSESLLEISNTPTPPGVIHWCCTKFKKENLNIIWTIENYSLCHKEVGEFIKSSTFSCETNSMWHLQLYPKGIKEEFKGYLSMYVYCNKSDIVAKWTFFILNGKGEKVNKMESSEMKKFVTLQNGYGWQKFIQGDKLLDPASNLLPEDKLTICAEICVNNDSVNTTKKTNTAVELIAPESWLSEDFGNLLETKKFSDVTLEIGDCEFHAHIAILAARSVVFAAMFEHEMEERKSNRVVIKDVDSEVFKEMLRFIYTGKVLNLDKLAKDLLALADKYALDKLKVLCEESLCVNLTIENATKTLILADLHNASQLKTKTIEFINNFVSHVIETSCWQNMLSTHAYLVTDILRRIIKHQAQ